MVRLTFTTYVAVDQDHYPELVLAAETWRKYRPEIWQNKLIVMADGRFNFDFLAHPDLDVIDPVYGPYTSQREKMLTSLALEPRWCKTEWFLKLDTDAIAVAKQKWFCQEWFESPNVLVASPWGYTKPASWLDDMDHWSAARSIPGKPPLRSGRVLRGVPVAMSPRITSYVMWGRTEFAQTVTSLVGLKLPVPSQDTVYWYLAKRLGRPILRADMRNFGWCHCGSSLARMQTLCRTLTN